MIFHKFKCDTCNVEVQDINTKVVHKCPKCGNDMYWDFSRVNICSAGDTKPFWSLEFGKLGKQQEEYKRTHPDAEFNRFGALKVHGFKHAQQLMKESGMVELTEKREYRDYMKDEHDKAAENINVKK